VREQIGSLPDPTAPLDERLEAFVEQRTRLNEFMAPVRRAAQLFEPFSAVVADKVELSRSTGAAQIEYVFAAELDACDGPAREELLAGLYTTAAWVNWESLRSHRGLPVDRARSVVRSMLAGQLKSRD
jgi:TetR/AcrR family transcriptional regulator of autoinduction and epiphytic fitness